MAKIPFSKLSCAYQQNTENINFNNQIITVKTTIPVQEKLNMISDIINSASEGDTTGYWNPGKIRIFTTLNYLYYYTNISFTDKQKADPAKLFDLVSASGLYQAVYSKVSDFDRGFISTVLTETLDNIYTYRNSVYGILDSMATDYSNLELDAEKLRATIGDPENISLLRDVITKMG